MLEHVIAIPLHNYPIELLPPAPQNRESIRAGRAQRRDRRRLLKITLQIPIGSKFGELLRHYSLTSTVRPAPGFIAPTESTESVNFTPEMSGGRAVPVTLFETIMPAGIVSVQYGAPFTFNCN